MLLELKKVSKTFGRKEEPLDALGNISLKIESGDFIALTGESGAGKTTLLGIISLNDSYEGELFIDGKNAALMTDSEKSAIKNKKIGILCQNYNLFPDLTIRENILLPLEYAAKGTEHYSCEDLADFFGIKDKLDAYPGTLSGGEKQRAALARALICSPELLIADEPTRNLDNENAEKLISLFKKLSEKGIAVIVSTHDESIAAKAKRHIHIKDGTAAEIFPCKEENIMPGSSNDFPCFSKNANNYKMPARTWFKHSLSYLSKNKAKYVFTFLLLTATITVSLVFYAVIIAKKFEKQDMGKTDRIAENIAGNIAEVTLKKTEKNISYEDILLSFSSGSLEKSGLIKKIVLPEKSSVIFNHNGNIKPELSMEIYEMPGWWLNHNFIYSRNAPASVTVLPEGMAMLSKKTYIALQSKQGSTPHSLQINGKSFIINGYYEEGDFLFFRTGGNAAIFPENSFSDIPHEAKTEALEIKTASENPDAALREWSDSIKAKNNGVFPGISVVRWESVKKSIQYFKIYLYAVMAAMFAIPFFFCWFGIFSLVMAGLKEKTKEISIKKIVGMSNCRAFWECVRQSMAITFPGCAIGGIIGTALGYFAIEDYKADFSCPDIIAGQSAIFMPKAFIITFGIIIAMSLIAGIIPAIKSIRISPADALKE